MKWFREAKHFFPYYNVVKRLKSKNSLISKWFEFPSELKFVIEGLVCTRCSYYLQLWKVPYSTSLLVAKLDSTWKLTKAPTRTRHTHRRLKSSQISCGEAAVPVNSGHGTAVATAKLGCSAGLTSDAFQRLGRRLPDLIDELLPCLLRA